MYGAGDLMHCLAQEQVSFCGHAVYFGDACLCMHPRRKEFVDQVIKSTGGATLDPQKE
jgi:hypothetical protein